MITASIGLALLAIALAGPVPVALAAAPWTARAPAAALLVWQSIALAGGLSMLGALFIAGLVPFGDTLTTSVSSLLGHAASGTLPTGFGLAHLLALAAGILLGAHLVLTLITAIARTKREQDRHRSLVALLSEPLDDRSDTRVIEQDAPIAYCLPVGFGSVTVLSAGLIRLLDAEQLRAVIAHEKGHLVQRHYVVLTAFAAWRSALPWFPTASRAHRAVGMLVEMLADDYARRSVGARAIAGAIERVAGFAPGALPGEALGTGDATVAPRIERLVGDSRPLRPVAHATVIAAAVLLIAIPTALLLVPR